LKPVLVFAAIAFAGLGLTAATSLEKIALVQVTYADGQWSEIDESIIQASMPKQLGFPETGGLRLQSFFENGSAAYTLFLGNPFRQTYERFLENGSIEGQTVTVDELNLTLIVPYSKEVTRVELQDNGSVLFSTDLAEATAFYCQIPDGVCDEDCSEDVDCATPTPEEAVASQTTPEPTPTATPTLTAQVDTTPIPSSPADTPATILTGLLALIVAILAYAALSMLTHKK